MIKNDGKEMCNTTLNFKNDIFKGKEKLLKMTIEEMVDKEYLSVGLKQSGGIHFSEQFYKLIDGDIKPNGRKVLFPKNKPNYIKKDLNHVNYRKELFEITLGDLFNKNRITIQDKGKTFGLNLKEGYFRIHKVKERIKCFSCGKISKTLMIDMSTNGEGTCAMCGEKIFYKECKKNEILLDKPKPSSLEEIFNNLSKEKDKNKLQKIIKRCIL